MITIVMKIMRGMIMDMARTTQLVLWNVVIEGVVIIEVNAWSTLG